MCGNTYGSLMTIYNTYIFTYIHIYVIYLNIYSKIVSVNFKNLSKIPLK